MSKTVHVVAIAAALCAQLAHADPDDYVATPAVEYGEREIELRFGTREQVRRRAPVGGVAGVRLWRHAVVGHRDLREVQPRGGASTRFDASSGRTSFSSTEPGAVFRRLSACWWNSSGRRIVRKATSYAWGPCCKRTSVGCRSTSNFLLERHYRASEPEVTELGYQWQVKYRWRPDFEFGAQGFGDMGKWNTGTPRTMQKHTLGPAIFGRITLGGRQALKYDAALLFKASSAAPTGRCVATGVRVLAAPTAIRRRGRPASMAEQRQANGIDIVGGALISVGSI